MMQMHRIKSMIERKKSPNVLFLKLKKKRNRLFEFIPENEAIMRGNKSCKKDFFPVRISD